jgi:hypothetical protein
MPNLNASDYTTFLKLQAASLAYQNNNIPSNRHTSQQPVPTVSILNAQLLASQASYVVTPKNTAIVGNARIRPRVPGNVNHPDALSTLTYSSSGTTSSSKTYQLGGPPSGRGNPGYVPSVLPRTSQG